MESQVIFDEILTNAFVAKAYEEGLAKPYSLRVLDHSYTMNILQTPLNFPNSWDLVVANMLIHKRTYLLPFDNFSLYDEYGHLIYPSGGASSRSSDIDVYKGGLTHVLFGSFEIKDDILPLQLTAPLFKAFIKISWDIDSNIRKVLLSKSENEIMELILRAKKYFDELDPEEELEFYQIYKFDHTYKLMSTVRSIYTKLLGFIEIVHKNNAVAGLYPIHKMDLYVLGRDVSREQIIETLKFQKDEYVIAGFIFTKLPWLRINNASDLMSLIERKEISDFRMEFRDILNGFQEGTLETQDLNRKFDKINEALKKVKESKLMKYGAYLTLLTLPVDVLLSYMGSPIGLGTVITIATLPLVIYPKWKLQREYKQYFIDLAL